MSYEKKPVKDSRRWQFHCLFFYLSTAVGPSPPSPPSPVNYQNERLQRQSAKLRKKLESRSNKTGSANVTANPTTSSAIETPPSSPKKGFFICLFFFFFYRDFSFFIDPFYGFILFLIVFHTKKIWKKQTDNNNIRKLKDRNQNGMPEIGLPAAGQDHYHHQQTEAANKKNDQEAMGERITELGAPQVCCRKS